ncbi:hypothetical protein [Actinoplanes subtropicus]|uniref:hypothetical protein n=1 Tax=Actinoplanes subtropicus TaxID=543632 RepID=UPI0004C4034C|nr:hypothetical protein [Actinoplanes subtropicus]
MRRVLLSVILAIAAGVVAVASPAHSASPVRIMAIGDSWGGYIPLQDKLTAFTKLIGQCGPRTRP